MNTERKLFEAWYTEHTCDNPALLGKDGRGEGYADAATDTAWESWKAALAGLATTSEMTHTPTPWIAAPNIGPSDDPSWNIVGFVEIDGFNGHQQCSLATVHSIEANAALIVRAVNSHDALVAALDKAMRVYGIDMQPEHREEIRAALAMVQP